MVRGCASKAVNACKKVTYQRIPPKWRSIHPIAGKIHAHCFNNDGAESN